MTAVPLIIALCAIGGVGTSLIVQSRYRALFVAIGIMGSSVAAIVLSASVIRSNAPMNVATRGLLPPSGIEFHLDSLGSLFVLVTAVVAIAVAVFSIGYARHHPLTRTGGAALSLFVTSMLLVPMAWNVTTFLALWEMMALSSLVLVLSEYRRGDSVRSAGLWYAVLTQTGAALIGLALLLLAAHAGSQDFTQIALRSGGLSVGVRGVAFLMMFVGFASKSGAVPFHVWLPKAHAEAPSAVSALMSAAMVNLGIYGVLRMGQTLLGGGPSWWWITVIVVGAVSAIYGSIHAATSTDLKRLLAYSTTDNVGLILIAIGTAGLLKVEGHAAFAALALFAGLFHMVNHSIFKGTLFLSAGSIQFTTGTRNLDELGGLYARMPIAGTVFAIGAVAISALPPLGGFVSEWLLLQSLLHGLSSSSTESVILMPLAVAALALTGGLTAAAFVKAFGVGFLGIPRSAAAENVKEPPALMNSGAILLGGACVVLGLAPMTMFSTINGAVRSLHIGSHGALSSHGAALAVSSAGSTFAPSIIAAVLVVALLLVGAIRWALSRPHSVRRTVAWGCGRDNQTARMTYTATSFAEPLQRVFDDIVQPQHDVNVTHKSESQYYVESVRYRTQNLDAFERLLYRPVFNSVTWVSRMARKLQNGSVHRYLAYGLTALVVLLLVAR